MATDKIAKKQIDVNLADLGNAGGMLSMASTVTQFIKDNGLSTNIQGKNFVNVEGWQFAGGMIGVLPIVQHTENLSTANELKYRASVDLINIKTGQKVGAGFATCSNKEKGKTGFQEYAIESMAQTRAIGKAYRLMLGWLMKAAGYEATPAEEMDFQTAEVVTESTKPAPAMKAQPAATQTKEAFISSHHPEVHQEVSDSLETSRYATSKQKAEIIKLLSNKTVTQAEKTKMLLNLDKLDEARAAQAIQKLTDTIKDREGVEKEIAA